MDISIIIVSSAKNKELYKMTQNAIDLAFNASNLKKEIIVVESENVKYNNVDKQLSSNNMSLNYNKFLNMGINVSTSEYIALCNNDLLFYENWDIKIISAMKENNILSASPFNIVYENNYVNNDIIYGYKIGKIICGWCIVVNKKVFEIISELNEGVEFWYSDNLYAKQLEKNKIKHALIKNSCVRHLHSKTLSTLSYIDKKKYTTNQGHIFYNIKV